MAGGGGGGDGGLEDHDLLAAGGYSQLLFADDVDDLDPDGCFNFTSSFSSENLNPPKMLSFGDYNGEEFDFVLDKLTKKVADQKSAGAVTCSDSSSASSTTNNSRTTSVNKTSVSSLPKSNVSHLFFVFTILHTNLQLSRRRIKG